jgi:hypothetical protein
MPDSDAVVDNTRRTLDLFQADIAGSQARMSVSTGNCHHDHREVRTSTALAGLHDGQLMHRSGAWESAAPQ